MAKKKHTNIIDALEWVREKHKKDANATCKEPWKHGSDLFSHHDEVDGKPYTFVSSISYQQSQDGTFKVSHVQTEYHEGHLNDGTVIMLWNKAKLEQRGL